MLNYQRYARSYYIKITTEEWFLETRIWMFNQRNLWTSLLRKGKASFFVRSKAEVTLVENSEIISDDAEIAKIFKNYFDKIVGNLDINQNLECTRKCFKKDLVLTLIEKYAAHSSIRNIKSRIGNINSKFSFKFVDHVKFLKELKC